MNEDAVWENVGAFKENDKIGNQELYPYPAMKRYDISYNSQVYEKYF